MRTCDCGWIAEWDLGDKISCTLYMLGIGDSDVGGEPPPGTRRCEDVEGVRRLLRPSPCSVGRYNYFRSQTRASRLRGIYTKSITICVRARARSGGDSSFRSHARPSALLPPPAKRPGRDR